MEFDGVLSGLLEGHVAAEIFSWRISKNRSGTGNARVSNNRNAVTGVIQALLASGSSLTTSRHSMAQPPSMTDVERRGDVHLDIMAGSSSARTVIEDHEFEWLHHFA